jgi:hypothetical protein
VWSINFTRSCISSSILISIYNITLPLTKTPPLVY